MYSNLNRLWLYNFARWHSFELLKLSRQVSSVQNLYIFGERDTRWLSKVEDPFVIEEFFKSFNSIPKYEITMSEDAQAVGFSRTWLKFIERKNLHLLFSFYEHNYQDCFSYNSNIVAAFYSGSAQSIPTLKYTISSVESFREISDSLNILDSQCFSRLIILGNMIALERLLKQIDAKERTHLIFFLFSIASVTHFKLTRHL